ncbi:hypothetical protein HanOQP8_Chr01g0011211 [Helianthus annuus]|nr:hypothetical protein HanOQP8_Chr01g0011211 [Helianthus annuus]
MSASKMTKTEKGQEEEILIKAYNRLIDYTGYVQAFVYPPCDDE